MELYFVRHGESVGNVTPGEDMPDCPLTDRGKKQAELVAKRLQDIEWTHILSSPLIRALETAQPLARSINKPIHVMPHAYEIRDLEDCKGATLKDLEKQFPEAIFPEDFASEGWHYAGHERPELAIQRAEKIIHELRKYPEEATVVLFAHGILNHYLIRALLGISHALDIHTEQKNTSIHSFTLTDTYTRIQSIGDAHHLRALENE